MPSNKKHTQILEEMLTGIAKGVVAFDTVEVCRRSSYGHARIYPVNANAGFFAQLTGRKTLNEADLAVIENLGYTIVWREDV